MTRPRTLAPLFAALAFCAYACRAAEIQDIAEVVAETEDQTGIPVAVPTVLPSVDESMPIYATLLTAEDGVYEINLGYAPECEGGNACSYGNLAGTRNTGEKRGTPNFPYDLNEAQVVALAGGVKGYYVASQCGANCDDAKMFWVQNGVQYMVGIKAGTEEEVIQMANSAIANPGSQ